MRTQWIRVYSQEDKTSIHSFHVAYMSGGISERVVSFDIDETTSFTDLRQMVCWQEYNGSYRRPIPLYSELLEAMKKSTNEYGYTKEDEREFRFGVVTCTSMSASTSTSTVTADNNNNDSSNNEIFPQIIQEEVEDEPIDQIIAPGLDLILVPLILIPKVNI
jgi:hypothetical protein